MACPPSKEHCYDRSDARNLIARDVIRDALKKIRPDDISVTSQLPVTFEIFMEMTKIEISGILLRAKKGFQEEKLGFQDFHETFKMYR